MEHEELLNRFGAALMKEVYDPSVIASRLILTGESKAEEDCTFVEFVNNQPAESKRLLEQLIGKTIDRTLFHFLSLFEQQQDFLLTAKTDEGLVDLNEVSDGLGGELWGEYGWIERFSDLDSYLDQDG